jgi:hypothetical protein
MLATKVDHTRMPFISLQRHRKPFRERPDIHRRLTDVVLVIKTLRALDLHASTKRKMIDRALWLVAELSGDFAPRHRSDGVLQNLGVKIQRDHVYPRAELIASILAGNEDLSEVVARAICCLVTKEEHNRLSEIPPHVKGWDRYREAAVIYRDMTSYAYPSEA